MLFVKYAIQVLRLQSIYTINDLSILSYPNNKPLLLTFQTKTLTKHPAEKDCSAPMFHHTMSSEGGVGDGISVMS